MRRLRHGDRVEWRWAGTWRTGTYIESVSRTAARVRNDSGLDRGGRPVLERVPKRLLSRVKVS